MESCLRSKCERNKHAKVRDGTHHGWQQRKRPALGHLERGASKREAGRGGANPYRKPKAHPRRPIAKPYSLGSALNCSSFPLYVPLRFPTVLYQVPMAIIHTCFFFFFFRCFFISFFDIYLVRYEVGLLWFSGF